MAFKILVTSGMSRIIAAVRGATLLAVAAFLFMSIGRDFNRWSSCGGAAVMRSNWLLPLAMIVVIVAPVRAEIKTRDISYEYGGVTFKGQLAWDDAAKGKRP